MKLYQHPLDACLFLLRCSEGVLHGALITHVDDLLLVGSPQTTSDVQQALSGMFPISEWEKEEFDYIGSQLRQGKDGTIHLGQRSYVNSRLESVVYLKPENMEDLADAITRRDISSKARPKSQKKLADFWSAEMPSRGEVSVDPAWNEIDRRSIGKSAIRWNGGALHATTRPSTSFEKVWVGGSRKESREIDEDLSRLSGGPVEMSHRSKTCANRHLVESTTEETRCHIVKADHRVDHRVRGLIYIYFL